MKASQLVKFLKVAFTNHQKVCLKGKPGIGKTQVSEQVAKEIGADLIVSHPAVEDPTVACGFPFGKEVKGEGFMADFAPFGNLRRAIQSKKLTIWVLEDFGQATPATQASYMNLLSSRRVNGHTLTEHVVFFVTTNDTTHMAGVGGLIEPVKSRFDTIVELEVSVDDWCAWAMDNDMPPELWAFIRNQPGLLSDFKPTKELRNSPSPRGWASVGRWMQAWSEKVNPQTGKVEKPDLAGVAFTEVYAGAVGDVAATKFSAFLSMCHELPSMDDILMHPDSTAIPTDPSALVWVASGLGAKLNASNAERALTYLSRIPQREFEIMAMTDALNRDKTKAFSQSKLVTKWLIANSEVLTG